MLFEISSFTDGGAITICSKIIRLSSVIVSNYKIYMMPGMPIKGNTSTAAPRE
jgi:hypothetical protein